METVVRSHLIAEALDAFWDVVTDAYPLAGTGDLSPLVSKNLEDAAEKAVAEWVANNA